jgi:hypothetical protein
MQPLVRDEDGRIRFKENAIIDWLFNAGKLNLNEIAVMEFPAEDRMQLAQLLGYTIDGYGELSYVTDESYGKAAEAAAKMSH